MNRKLILRVKFFGFLLVAIIMLFLIWRLSFDRIGHILNRLPEYDGKRAYLLGRAYTPISLPFVGSIYKLNDGSGEIWVVSAIDSTRTGQVIFIEGIVQRKIDPEKTGLIKLFKKEITPFALEETGPIFKEEKRSSFLVSLKMIARRKPR